MCSAIGNFCSPLLFLRYLFIFLCYTRYTPFYNGSENSIYISCTKPWSNLMHIDCLPAGSADGETSSWSVPPDVWMLSFHSPVWSHHCSFFSDVPHLPIVLDDLTPPILATSFTPNRIFAFCISLWYMIVSFSVPLSHLISRQCSFSFLLPM